MMDLIFIIGIGLLFTLLVVIVGIYGYLRIFPWRQTVLSLDLIHIVSQIFILQKSENWKNNWK